MKLPRRNFIISGMVLGINIFSDAYSQDWLERLKRKAEEAKEIVKEKATEAGERAREWSDRTREDLEEKTREGSETARNVIHKKSLEMASRGQDYYREHQDDVKRFVEYEVNELINDPSRVTRYGGMLRDWSTKKSIEAISNISVQDKSGRMTTLGSLASNYQIGGNNPIEIGVYATFATFTTDPRFITRNLKIIRTEQGYLSMDQAIGTGYKREAVEALKRSYINSQRAFESGDDATFSSEASSFVENLDAINSRQETGEEKTERVINGVVKQTEGLIKGLKDWWNNQ